MKCLKNCRLIQMLGEIEGAGIIVRRESITPSIPLTSFEYDVRHISVSHKHSHDGGLKMGQCIMISRLEHFQSRPTILELQGVSNCLNLGLS